MHTISFSGPGLASISRCTGILIRISYLKSGFIYLPPDQPESYSDGFPHYLDSLAYVLHTSHSVVVQYMIQIDFGCFFALRTFWVVSVEGGRGLEYFVACKAVVGHIRVLL